MKRRIRAFGKWLALAVWILAAGFCYSCGQQEEAVLLSTAESVQEEEAASQSTDAKTAAACLVHVCGEVVCPGVYELKEGQRVYEAIAMAGGFTQEAAQSALNLAEPVYDGMKLTVPDQEQADQTVSGAGTEAGGKIDINTASKEQLKTLRGIGDARADDIIRYRQEHGRFQKIEDIMKVPGIKDSAFEKIKDDISAGP